MYAALTVACSLSLCQFSAGLDLKEFNKPELARVEQYWSNLQSMFSEIYGSRLFTVARMNGHSIAGGCVLSMAADYRVSLAGTKVGMTEAALGMTLPWWIERMVRDLVGPRACERWVTLALVEDAAVAAQAGFVDAVADGEGALDELVAAELKRALKIPSAARAANKLQTRANLLGGMISRHDQDVEYFASMITSPPLQAAIGAYAASLAKK